VCVTHWGGCYNRSTAPYLIDGAQQAWDFGTRALKINLVAGRDAYRWNSPQWPTRFGAAVEAARHPYVRAVLDPAGRFQWTTVTMVAYALHGNGSNNNYWRDSFTPEDAAREEEQFRDLTVHLLETYPDMQFVLQHWEGDWSIRPSSDPSLRPTALAIRNMIAWLGARQRGVEEGRKIAAATRGRTATLGGVFHASEVNLVRSSMQTGFPNVVNEVLPHVALDMVSYSSYDTQGKGGQYGYRAALEFIAQHANRTQDSPAEYVYIGEYGTKQRITLPAVTEAVNRVAASVVLGNASARPLDFVARACFWEMYGNDLVGGLRGEEQPVDESGGLPGWLLQRAQARRAEIEGGLHAGGKAGRCLTQPVYNESQLGGLWLVRPDGSHAWPYDYLRGRILGG